MQVEKFTKPQKSVFYNRAQSAGEELVRLDLGKVGLFKNG